jgi:hypothetical protein
MEGSKSKMSSNEQIDGLKRDIMQLQCAQRSLADYLEVVIEEASIDSLYNVIYHRATVRKKCKECGK